MTLPELKARLEKDREKLAAACDASHPEIASRIRSEPIDALFLAVMSDPKIRTNFLFIAFGEKYPDLVKRVDAQLRVRESN